MSRNEAATILARSLLAAGYTRNPDTQARTTWLAPDGHPATRAYLQAHVIQAYQGGDRDPFLDFLGASASLHWRLVDKAAALIPASF